MVGFAGVTLPSTDAATVWQAVRDTTAYLCNVDPIKQRDEMKEKFTEETVFNDLTSIDPDMDLALTVLDVLTEPFRYELDEAEGGKVVTLKDAADYIKTNGASTKAAAKKAVIDAGAQAYRDSQKGAPIWLRE